MALEILSGEAAALIFSELCVRDIFQASLVCRALRRAANVVAVRLLRQIVRIAVSDGTDHIQLLIRAMALHSGSAICLHFDIPLTALRAFKAAAESVLVRTHRTQVIFANEALATLSALKRAAGEDIFRANLPFPAAPSHFTGPSCQQRIPSSQWESASALATPTQPTALPTIPVESQNTRDLSMHEDMPRPISAPPTPAPANQSPSVASPVTRTTIPTATAPHTSKTAKTVPTQFASSHRPAPHPSAAVLRRLSIRQTESPHASLSLTSQTSLLVDWIHVYNTVKANPILFGKDPHLKRIRSHAIDITRALCGEQVKHAMRYLMNSLPCVAVVEMPPAVTAARGGNPSAQMGRHVFYVQTRFGGTRGVSGASSVASSSVTVVNGKPSSSSSSPPLIATKGARSSLAESFELGAGRQADPRHWPRRRPHRSHASIFDTFDVELLQELARSLPTLGEGAAAVQLMAWKTSLQLVLLWEHARSTYDTDGVDAWGTLYDEPDDEEDLDEEGFSGQRRRESDAVTEESAKRLFGALSKAPVVSYERVWSVFEHAVAASLEVGRSSDNVSEGSSDLYLALGLSTSSVRGGATFGFRGTLMRAIKDCFVTIDGAMELSERLRDSAWMAVLRACVPLVHSTQIEQVLRVAVGVFENGGDAARSLAAAEVVATLCRGCVSLPTLSKVLWAGLRVIRRSEQGWTTVRVQDRHAAARKVLCAAAERTRELFDATNEPLCELPTHPDAFEVRLALRDVWTWVLADGRLATEEMDPLARIASSFVPDLEIYRVWEESVKASNQPLGGNTPEQSFQVSPGSRFVWTNLRHRFGVVMMVQAVECVVRRLLSTCSSGGSVDYKSGTLSALLSAATISRTTQSETSSHSSTRTQPTVADFEAFAAVVRDGFRLIPRRWMDKLVAAALMTLGRYRLQIPCIDRMVEAIVSTGHMEGARLLTEALQMIVAEDFLGLDADAQRAHAVAYGGAIGTSATVTPTAVPFSNVIQALVPDHHPDIADMEQYVSVVEIAVAGIRSGQTLWLPDAKWKTLVELSVGRRAVFVQFLQEMLLCKQALPDRVLQLAQLNGGESRVLWELMWSRVATAVATAARASSSSLSRSRLLESLTCRMTPSESVHQRQAFSMALQLLSVPSGPVDQHAFRAALSLIRHVSVASIAREMWLKLLLSTVQQQQQEQEQEQEQEPDHFLHQPHRRHNADAPRALDLAWICLSVRSLGAISGPGLCVWAEIMEWTAQAQEDGDCGWGGERFSYHYRKGGMERGGGGLCGAGENSEKELVEAAVLSAGVSTNS